MHEVAGDQHASTADYLAALQLGQPERAISCFVEEGPVVAEALEKVLVHVRLGTVKPAYAKQILAAFDSAGKAAAAQGIKITTNLKPDGDSQEQIIEALTGWAMEVLGLMTEGLNYEEIGDRLYISLNTVRTHVKAIYGKLNVNNRTKAIKTAHVLG